MPYRYCGRCATVFYSAVSYTRFERCPNCDGPLRPPPTDQEPPARIPTGRFARRPARQRDADR
jgi:hypothetical protein